MTPGPICLRKHLWNLISPTTTDPNLNSQKGWNESIEKIKWLHTYLFWVVSVSHFEYLIYIEILFFIYFFLKNFMLFFLKWETFRGLDFIKFNYWNLNISPIYYKKKICKFLKSPESLPDYIQVKFRRYLAIKSENIFFFSSRYIENAIIINKEMKSGTEILKNKNI